MDVEVQLLNKCHLRYPLDESGGKKMVIALHGYGEGGAMMIERLSHLPQNIQVVAPDGLHPIYLSNGRNGFSWMTSHDRDFQVQNNMGYLRQLIEQISARHSWSSITWLGYSQGAQMAARGGFGLFGDHLVMVAAEVPPELRDAGEPMYASVFKPDHGLTSAVHLRGKKDMIYKGETRERDRQWLEQQVPSVKMVDMVGGHQWISSWDDSITEALL